VSEKSFIYIAVPRKLPLIPSILGTFKTKIKNKKTKIKF